MDGGWRTIRRADSIATMASVLVIIGAGASYDCVSRNRPGGWITPGLRPPLTQDVFRDDDHTRPILSKYDGARLLATNIRIDLQNGKQLEPLLRVLADNSERPVARQFPEIALYLQEFFSEISTYTDQPANYNRLAQALFTAIPRFDRICFVTMNYETLLDDVVFPNYFEVNRQDVTIDSYISDAVLLVKLHGSINWIRKLGVSQKFDRRLHYTDADYLGLIRDLTTDGLKRGLEPQIHLKNPAERLYKELKSDENYRYMEISYPAISVPLGTYDKYFACPREHVDALEQFLPECKNVLVIGTSGKDEDLLTLLQEKLPPVLTLHIVEVDPSAFDATYRNLNNVPQFQVAAGKYTGGFTDFIMDGGIQAFLDDCDKS